MAFPTMPAARTAVRPERRSAVGGNSVAAAPEPERPRRGLFPLRRRARILGQGQQFHHRDRAVFRHQGLRLPGRALGAVRRSGRARRDCASSAIRAILRAGARRPTRCAISSPRASAATAGTASTIRPTTARRRSIRTFVKQDCSKTIDGVGIATLQTRYLRKKGQSQFDPRTDRETEGQFESLVRFELTKSSSALESSPDLERSIVPTARTPRSSSPAMRFASRASG